MVFDEDNKLNQAQKKEIIVSLNNVSFSIGYMQNFFKNSDLFMRMFSPKLNMIYHIQSHFK